MDDALTILTDRLSFPQLFVREDGKRDHDDTRKFHSPSMTNIEFLPRDASRFEFYKAY